MRTLIPVGWLMIVLGVVLGIGGIAAGIGSGAVTGAILMISLAGSGVFMLWLGRGWDTPLEDASELYAYGRPANAEVLSVAEQHLGADGTRTAKLRLRVSPVNESAYTTERTVALPGGREPAVGQTITIKFDPQSRKNFVVLEQGFEVKDQITATADAFFGGLQKS